MIINRYILVIIFMVSELISINSFGQTKQFHVDSAENIAKRITFAEFDRRINGAIKLLQTKDLSKITDSDHVNIIMCLNTIFMNSLGEKFKRLHCKKLLWISNKVDYMHKIDKIYPNWIFNRGMGHYYPKIKKELYGTPNMYATFDIQ